jgi:hypothetical protein
MSGDLIFLGHSTPAQDAALLEELDKALAALDAAKRRRDSESIPVSVPCSESVDSAA